MTKKEEEKLRNRLKEVFIKFVEWTDKEDLKEIKDRLNEWLDEYHGEDRFGTEGQLDPRGDARDIERKPRI